MTPGVHQVLAGMADRDAISNHALAAQQVIRGMGLRSEIFVDDAHIAPTVAERVHAHYDWDRITEPRDRAILHYSIDSPAFDHVLQRAQVCAMHYHNVTPPELLWRDMPHLAAQCRDGRDHLTRFAGQIGRSAADSVFNGREMTAAGLPPATVIGILRQPLAIPSTKRTPDGPTNASTTSSSPRVRSSKVEWMPSCASSAAGGVAGPTSSDAVALSRHLDCTTPSSCSTR